MTRAILRVSPASYGDVRNRILDVDKRLGLKVYERDMVRPPRRPGDLEHLDLDGIMLEADPTVPEGDVQRALEVIRASLRTPEQESAFYALEALLTS